MKETKIRVLEKDLNELKKACYDLHDVNFILYDSEKETASITYEYDFNLFYLGVTFTLTQQLKELRK